MKRLISAVMLLSCLFASVSLAQTLQVTFGNQLDFNFFEANVAPVFRDVCAGCHGGGNAAARSVFPLQMPSADNRYTDEQLQRDFEEAAKRVQFKNPQNSRLLLKPTGQVMHGGGQQIAPGSKEAKAFVDWINGAALKERVKPATPQGQPDEKQFADQVMPILVSKCASVCHGGKNTMAKSAFPMEVPGANNQLSPSQLKRFYEATLKKVKFKDPEGSPLLRKATGKVTHGGGEVIKIPSPEYDALVSWVNGSSASGGLDRAFFVDYVQPILARRCALPACHGGSNSVAGKIFHIYPPQPNGQMLAEHTESNWKAVLSQYRAVLKRETSKLLTKPTGRTTHGGGTVLDLTNPDHQKDYDIIAKWILEGAVSTNARPLAAIAPLGEVPVGAPVVLDASASRDPDGDKLAFHWTVTAKPMQAPPPTVEGQGQTARFLALAPGVYTLSLVVNDGKIDSSPAFVHVVVIGEGENPQLTGPAIIPPAQPDAPPTVPFVRRAYLDVLGRPPTLTEVDSAMKMTRAQLVARLFRSLEYDQNWFEEQLSYLFLTGQFRPDSEEVTRLPIQLFNKELTQMQALQILIASRSFQERNPGAAHFVLAAFEQLVGTLPTVQYLQHGVKQMEAHKPLELLQQMMNTPELASTAWRLWAHRLFRKYLGIYCPEDLL
ncbi:MAG: hypothetical protein NZT92_20880, partial [Abditibacteriales bacterium]|nr:hypothetical protein [Abditibacteriales bacterium]MDW8368167.1 hypothetical protein [Abditibacteriales bacterium]